ncbi:MAG TPA: GNAT family protein [Vicinamibacterales bacterium]|nr:GNAT family protein [Vicinamibacterales bacterium]
MANPLETPRLRLRFLQAGDEEGVYRLLSDERVIQHMLFPLFTRERASKFVTRLQDGGETQTPPQVVYAIELRDSTAEAAQAGDGPVGLCGLVLRPEMQDAEAWYLLHPVLWGRGLLSEAMAAVVDDGFRHRGLHRIWATCLPENPASARVLERLRFRREGLLREGLRIHGEWRDALLYALLASEWSSGRATGS